MSPWSSATRASSADNLQPFSAQLNSTGGTDLEWVATGAPAWLRLSRSGRLSGVPSELGKVTFLVTLTGAQSFDEAKVIVKVTGPPASALTVRDQRVTGVLRQELTHQLHATGGDGSYTWWHLRGGVPGLSSSRAGVLSGKPLRAGTWTMRVQAISTLAGERVSQKAQVRIDIDSPFKFDTRAALPPAERGARYSTAIRTEGAVGAIRWTQTSGTLPRGLRYVARKDRLIIKGRAQVAATRDVKFRAVDEVGRRIMRTFIVRVER